MRLRSNKCLILVQQQAGRSVDHSLMISGDQAVINSLQSATNTHNNVPYPLFFPSRFVPFFKGHVSRDGWLIGRSVDHSFMISGDQAVISSLQSATNTHNNAYPLPFSPRFVPFKGHVSRDGRWVATRRCVAKLIVSLLASAALCVRIQTSLKNTKWAT